MKNKILLVTGITLAVIFAAVIVSKAIFQGKTSPSQAKVVKTEPVSKEEGELFALASPN